MNELLFFLSIVAVFSLLLAVYRLFGKTGIFCWISFVSVFANIAVIKTVSCFGITTTLGNVAFGSVFLATDILSEKYDKKSADKAVYIGLFCNVVFVILSQIARLYKPADGDIAQEAFEIIFSMTPRVCLGSICAFIVGNLTDIYLFDILKRAHGSKLLWFRNNFCTMLSQLIDNFVLHFIAFGNFYSVKQIIILSLNVWVIEAVVSICDTPVLYLAKKIKGGLYE